MMPSPPSSSLFPYTTLFRSMPLYAFSNTNPAHVAHFSQAYADVLSHFRQIFLSSSIGLRKPDAEAYDHVVKDRKSTRLNSSHRCISYAVFCLKKKKTHKHNT